MITPLIQHYLACDNPDETHTLVRRVLTALIHHCKGADQFAPVSDVIIKLYLDELNTADEERIRRVLEVVSVVCSVRQGSRMTRAYCHPPPDPLLTCDADKQLGSLLEKYSTIPAKDTLHASLLKFATSALMAGDMALWMAHARRVLDRSWEQPLLGIELTGALSDLSWGGWKLVALPYLSTNTHKLLETHPAQTLELLAALNRERRLSDMDIVWKQRFQTWVDQRFSTWQHNTENVRRSCLHGTTY